MRSRPLSFLFLVTVLSRAASRMSPVSECLKMCIAEIPDIKHLCPENYCDSMSWHPCLFLITGADVTNWCRCRGDQRPFSIFPSPCHRIWLRRIRRPSWLIDLDWHPYSFTRSSSCHQGPRLNFTSQHSFSLFLFKSINPTLLSSNPIQSNP